MASPEEVLEKKIRATYKQAAREIKKKTAEFWTAHKRKSAELLSKVASGEITQADYQRWLRGQVFTGKRWEEKLKDITNVYVNADKKAREIIGGTTKNVFIDAANQTAYNMEKDFVGGISFDLYDGKTVERLLKDDPKMLPEWKIDEPKDYVWNEKRVRNAVTQGIIQGESVYDIGKRLFDELSAQNASKMNMFARTAVTGAQNAGRIERLHEAEKMGIEVKKQWIATHDKRVRDTHDYLDGQIVGVDEPFKVDDMEIDYPGDPLAPPELVYNCRCTLAYIYPKYQKQKRWEDQRTGEELPYKTFTEWKAAKQGKQKKREQQQESSSFGVAVSSIGEKQTRERIQSQIEKSPDFARNAWEKASDKMKAPYFEVESDVGGAYYSPADGKTHYASKEKAYEQSDYQERSAVYFHEYGHNIDHILGGGGVGNPDEYLSVSYNNGEFEKTLKKEVEKSLTDFYIDANPENLYVKILDTDDFGVLKSIGEIPGGVPVESQLKTELRKMSRSGKMDIDTRLQLFEQIDKAVENKDFDTLKEIFEKNVEKDGDLRKYLVHERETAKEHIKLMANFKSNAEKFCEAVKKNYDIYERSDISDMFDGYLSVNCGIEYGIGVGHGTDYFRGKGRLAREAFAEMYSATMVNGKSLPTIKQFFPESYKVFQKMLGGI